MIYLILAIASSTLVSMTMRISEKYTNGGTVKLAVNYLACSLLAACYTGIGNLAPRTAGAGTALMLGIVGGVLYMGSFALMQWNIASNGVVLSTTFMKLGVLVPTLMSVVIFHEVPGFLQILGIVIAVTAIILIHLEKDHAAAARTKAGLLLLLLAGGGADAMSKIYEQLGVPALKDQFLLYIFLCALLLCIGVSVFQKQAFTRADLLAGLCIGIPNYYSARFLLLSLNNVPAVIAYPTYSAGTIIVVTLLGILFFHERPSRRQKAAIALILAALILLNL